MIRKELLDILQCPNCEGELKYNTKKNILECVKCEKEYPIKNDIPILLIDKKDIENVLGG